MSTLGTYLSHQGFDVVDSPVEGRPQTWSKVRWIFVHHTGSNCSSHQSAADAAYVKKGSFVVPGPMCHLLLGQDHKVYVISEQKPGQNEPGRANHAGTGSYPNCNGNADSLGIEVQCQGTHALSTHTDQYAVLIDLIASLCRRYGLSAERVIGHKEWAPDRKVDPRDNMTTLRTHVAMRLNDNNLGDIDMPLSDADIDKIAQRVWSYPVAGDEDAPAGSPMISAGRALSRAYSQGRIAAVRIARVGLGWSRDSKAMDVPLYKPSTSKGDSPAVQDS